MRAVPVTFLAALLIVGTAILFWPAGILAQDSEGFGLSAHSQTEYSLSRNGDLEILLEWLDVDATYKDFIGGIRYEAFQPPRPGDPLGEEIRQGFPYRYLQMDRDWGTIRAGNYYTIFGRGLSLNLFEDRDVRIDANLDGIQYRGESHGFGLTAMTGRVRSTTVDRWRTDSPSIERLDLVHAADLTYRPIEEIRIGGTVTTNRFPGIGDEDEVRDMRSLRGEAWAGPVAIYAETGRLENPGEDDGEGTYVSATMSGAGYGLLAEARDYDDFDFHSSDGRIYLNNPPAGTREHAYTLLNRHPHVLNAADERGYQFEATLSPFAGTIATLNHSQTEDHTNRTMFREYYAELHHGPELLGVSELTGLADHQKDRATESITLIGEGTIGLSENISLKVQFGNQHVKGDAIGEYDDKVAVVEVSRAPGITAGVTTEWTNKSDAQILPDEDKVYAQANVGFQLIEGTDLELLYGSRQAGYYCVGGRCRYEPAFEGFEFKLLTRF